MHDTTLPTVLSCCPNCRRPPATLSGVDGSWPSFHAWLEDVCLVPRQPRHKLNEHWKKCPHCGGFSKQTNLIDDLIFF